MPYKFIFLLFFSVKVISLVAQQAEPQTAKEKVVVASNKQILANLREKKQGNVSKLSDYRLYLLKTKHFHIYHLAMNAKAARHILGYAERYYEQIQHKFKIGSKPIRIFLNPLGSNQGGFSGFTPPHVHLMLYSDPSSESMGLNWQEYLEANFAYQLGRYMLLTYDGSHGRVLTNILRYATGPDSATLNFLLMPLWLYTAFGYSPYTVSHPYKERQTLSAAFRSRAATQRAILESVYLRGILLEPDSFTYYQSFSESAQNLSAQRTNNALAYLMLRYLLKNYGPDVGRDIVENVHRRLGLNAAFKKVTGKNGLQLFKEMRKEFLGNVEPTSDRRIFPRIFPSGGSLSLPQNQQNLGDFILERSNRDGNSLRLYPSGVLPKMIENAPRPLLQSAQLPVSRESPFAIGPQHIVINRRAISSAYIPIPVVTIPITDSDLYKAKLPTGMGNLSSKSPVKDLKWTRLTKGKNLFSPVFSSNGRYLVAVERTRPGHHRIVEVNQQNGQLRVLVENPNYNFLSPSFSHRGAKLLLEAHSNGQIDIALLDLELPKSDQNQNQTQKSAPQQKEDLISPPSRISLPKVSLLFRSEAWELAPRFSQDDQTVLFATSIHRDTGRSIFQAGQNTQTDQEATQENKEANSPENMPQDSNYTESRAEMALLSFHLNSREFHLEARDPVGILGAVEAADGGLYYRSYRGKSRKITTIHTDRWGAYSVHYVHAEHRAAMRQMLNYPAELENQYIPNDLQNINEPPLVPSGYYHKPNAGLVPIISSWLVFPSYQKVFKENNLSLNFSLNGSTITNTPFMFQLSYFTKTQQIAGKFQFGISMGPFLGFRYSLSQNFHQSSQYQEAQSRSEFFAQYTLQELATKLPLPGISGLRHRLEMEVTLKAQHRLRAMGLEPFSFGDSANWNGHKHYGIAQFGFRGDFQARIVPMQTSPIITRNFKTPSMKLGATFGFWGKPLDAPYTPRSIRNDTQTNYYYGASWSWQFAFPSPSMLGLFVEAIGSMSSFPDRPNRGNAAEYLTARNSRLSNNNIFQSFLDGTPSDWAWNYRVKYSIPLLNQHLAIGGMGFQSLLFSLGLDGRSYFSNTEQYYGTTAHLLSALIGVSGRIRIGSFFVPTLGVDMVYSFFDETKINNPGWYVPTAERLAVVITLGNRRKTGVQGF